MSKPTDVSIVSARLYFLEVEGWGETMELMVQDLTNPMLAQVPHGLLAAHAGTMMGLESNAMQYYPEASLPEASVHPGLFRRHDGVLDLRTLGKAGFGYRGDEIGRELPRPVVG